MPSQRKLASEGFGLAVSDIFKATEARNPIPRISMVIKLWTRQYQQEQTLHAVRDTSKYIE